MIDKHAIELWAAVTNMIDAIAPNLDRDKRIELIHKACDTAVDVIEIGVTGGLSKEAGH